MQATIQRTLVLFAVVSLLFSSAGSSSGEELEAYRAIRPHMGTRFAFTVYAASPKQAQTALDRANRRIAEIEEAMSDYRPDSEIRQLAVRAARQETAKDDRRQDHPLGGFQPLSISRDLRSVLAAARRVGKLSGGAFDVSVSPLSQLWRKSKASGELPPADELASAKAVVGPQNWRLGEAGVTMKPGVAFDLGGIAKGYALDESLKALKASGVNVALIDGGGDLIAGDPPPGRETWRVGVAPLEAGGEPKWIIPLVNSAASRTAMP